MFCARNLFGGGKRAEASSGNDERSGLILTIDGSEMEQSNCSHFSEDAYLHTERMVRMKIASMNESFMSAICTPVVENDEEIPAAVVPMLYLELHICTDR